MCMYEALRSVSRSEEDVEREVIHATAPYILSLYVAYHPPHNDYRDGVKISMGIQTVYYVHTLSSLKNGFIAFIISFARYRLSVS